MKTIVARRKAAGVTLTELKKRIAATPAGAQRNSYRKGLRARGWLGPRKNGGA